MKFTFTFLLLSLTLMSYGQTDFDCDNMLDQTPKFAQCSNDKIDSTFSRDIEILKHCGSFDSTSIIFLEKPILASLIIQLVTKQDKDTLVTYRSILQYINDFKKSEEYDEFSKTILLYNKLENKKIDLSTWEEDKKLFSSMGISQITLTQFKEFISKPENLNLTYKEAFSIFTNKIFSTKNSKNIKQTPFELEQMTSYETAIIESSKENKPLFLFFTCYGCTSALEMENKILSDSLVKSIISEKFIAYSLYVNDKSELATQDQYTSKQTGKQITTKGQKFMDLEISKFDNYGQPYFVIIDSNENILAKTGYLNEKDKFIEFLLKGIK